MKRPGSRLRFAARLGAAAIALSVAASAAPGAELPVASERDARLRYVHYVRDQVTVIHVRRGSVTRIMLEAGERIVVAATGFSADCAKAELEWCVRADVGTNQIWVKPKENASFNNLELHTDRRDYSFEFRVLPDAQNGRSGKTTPAALQAEPMFRVMFQYPMATPVSAMLAAGVPGRAAGGRESDPGAHEAANTPQPRNWSYSMQVMADSQDLAPRLVFDDGRFTYFQFPGNREIPSIFYRSTDGEEGRVNFHMRGDLAVVERTARQFVLRLGKAVVGIWNEQYDAEGTPPVSGTTVPDLVRTVKPIPKRHD